VIVADRRGRAAELHRIDWSGVTGIEVWSCRAEPGALVLGSAARGLVVDEALAEAEGLDVVTRGSGGGAVLLEPQRAAWVDVVVSRGDPWWVDDVARSMVCLGEVWVAALGSLGIEARVHTEAMACGALGPAVCFGGVGPGEVTVAGAKAVGIAQRRTRHGARFQCIWYRNHDAGLLADLLAPSIDLAVTRSALAGAVAELDLDPDTVLEAVVDQLGRLSTD